ncbi:mannitol dehydrogenase [Chryseobacterium piperi]|uniref:Mannitol dehydrogenase n=1 Tax=Chryseobacterium piperi TaxID=558152 RepID=A0A086B2F2_9FLAO|nr:mannitol dehydrogenase family protein [Chryseobacterium piperi]ASW73044.1 mannitol dehydrogenase family protein [Chryseobacterium piperi]KFF23116.1 mannitol dehydrogenase [Chryseobacterium piperi]
MTPIAYQYQRENITTGIVHIGVGNFHRAHQQYYTNLLLENKDQQQWGICGIALLPSDEKIVQNLRSQNLDYTLTVCGRHGQDEVHIIGSLNELIWGIEDPKAVIDKIAEDSVKIISLTITEGGYNLDKETNEFNLNDEEIQHDLKNPSAPKTVFGFIAEGLRQRKNKGVGGLTILSCDNLQHNGDTAKKAFTAFIEAQDQDLAAWVKTNVTFPNSMVDRITPATTAEDIEKLNKNSGWDDKAPVYCEDFIQWVIEDQFIAGRPAWEETGVEFTDDVTAFENMKLSLLNASHTLLSYPSFLKGYRKVDDAMNDPDIVHLIQDFMDMDITPYVPAPKNIDLDFYKQTLIQRFANPSVSDQVSRLCFDGVSKFPVYIMPNLAKMINDQQSLIRMAFLIASYRHYLKYKTDDHGASFEIGEPWLTADDQVLIQSDESIDFLGLSPFKSIDLKKAEVFVKWYTKFVEELKENGVTPVLESILN